MAKIKMFLAEFFLGFLSRNEQAQILEKLYKRQSSRENYVIDENSVEVTSTDEFDDEWVEAHKSESIGEALDLRACDGWFSLVSVTDLPLSRRALDMYIRYTPDRHRTLDELLEENVQDALRRYRKYAFREIIWTVQQYSRISM